MPPEKGPAPTQVKSEVAKDSCENREEVDTSGEATRRVQEVTTTITTSCITEMEGDLFDAPENAVLIREYLTFHGLGSIDDGMILP